MKYMIKFSEMSRISGIEKMFDPYSSDPDDTLPTIDDLRALWLCPSEIEEFSVYAENLSLKNIMVAKVAGYQDEHGYCYLSELYGILEGKTLVAIDERNLHGKLSLQDVFLHEIAHTKTVQGEEHDWQFVVALNMLRFRCGLPCTRDGYDCSQVDNPDEKSIDEILTMAAIVAEKLEQSWGFDVGLQVVRFLNYIPSYNIDTSFPE